MLEKPLQASLTAAGLQWKLASLTLALAVLVVVSSASLVSPPGASLQQNSIIKVSSSTEEKGVEYCSDNRMTANPIRRYPAVFICHGGGPMPVLGDPSQANLAKELRKLGSEMVAKNGKPRAICVISAHYEAHVMSIGGSAKPKMIYDYGGFPAEAYKLKYPAPGDSQLATQISQLLTKSNIRHVVEDDRGYDHGVFVPLMLMFPDADIPVVPISVLRSQDPKEHIAVGEALAPLREEGIFFVGSGSSTHNFAYFFRPETVGATFSDQLIASLTDPQLTADQRATTVSQFLSFDKAFEAQVKGAAEHFMPLLTIVGLAKRQAASAFMKTEMLNSIQTMFTFE